MKIIVKGREVEAYPLLMRKENALEILNGCKTIEFRSLSKKYDKMFTDRENIAYNEKMIAEGREDEANRDIIRGDVEYIHFYSTNAPWTLDVAIDEIGIVSVHPEDAAYLQERFGSIELFESAEQFKDKEIDDCPAMFYLHITEIVNHEGLK